MANEVMRTISFHVSPIVATDSVVDFEAIEQMTIVGVSFCAEVLTGTPTATTIDIQVDGTDVIAAIVGTTALVPGTWKSVHMGGTEDAIAVPAGSEIEIDLNLTAGSTPTAQFSVVIWYLGGSQG